jgi:hypothetical protein
MKFLTRRGFLIAEQGTTYLTDTDPDLALGPLQAAACTCRIALGPSGGCVTPKPRQPPTTRPGPDHLPAATRTTQSPIGQCDATVPVAIPR